MSVTERKSRWSLIYKVERRTTENVAATMLKSLDPMRCLIHILTADNGTEFAEHKLLVKQLEAKFLTGRGNALSSKRPIGYFMENHLMLHLLLESSYVKKLLFFFSPVFPYKLVLVSWLMGFS